MDTRTVFPTSLRHALLARFGLLAGVTAMLVVLIFAVFGLRPMSARIAENQFNTTAEQVEARFTATFKPTEHLLRMSRFWIDGKAPEIDGPEQFNRLFQPMLETLPHITSVVAGTSAGQGWMLLRQADGSMHNRLTDIPRWGNRHRMIDRRGPGDALQQWKTTTYDARLRPWFTGAMAVPEHAFHWTAPYAFYTTGDPGVTVSTRFKLDDGRDFVLGFDLMLRDLSKSTMQAEIGRHGLALVITDGRRVVALPARPGGTPEREWLDRILKPVDQLGLAPVTDALAAWTQRRQAQGVFAYRTGTVDWLASIRPYTLGSERFWLLTLAPESDFAPAWQPIVFALTAGMMLVLLVATLFAYRQAGKLSRPMEALAKVSERIGRLDFSPAPTIETDIFEVAQLAAAQAGMTDMLRRDQGRLADQARELSDRIKALEQAKARLRESEQHFRNMANSGSTLIWISGVDKLCNYFNEPWLKFTGRTLEQELGNGWVDGVYPEDRQRCLDTYASAFDRHEPFSMDYRLCAASGEYRWLHDEGVPRYDSEGLFLGYIGYCFDITERKQTEAAVRENELKYRQLFESANDGIVIYDSGYHILDSNDKAATMLGLPRERLIGLSPLDVSPIMQPDGCLSADIAAEMSHTALNGEPQFFQWQALRSDGTLIYLEITLSRLVLHGEPCLQAILRDITERKQAEEQIHSLAYFDPLTNLPNRRLLMDRLSQALIASQRSQAYGALLIMDLDNFKALNDTQGHDAGDQLLIEVAGKLLACVRQHDTVSRLGGDEYVVMLEGLDQEESAAARQAETVGEKVRAALDQPFAHNGGNHGYHISTSIGLTLFRGRDISPEGLLKQADVALYQAKDSGKNVIRFFNPSMQAEIDARMALESALRRGLENGEFRLHYQPQFDQDDCLIGAEALLRWLPPGQATVPPDRFIGVAEDTGLILPIGIWVLETACRQLKAWDSDPGHRGIPIAVNVSSVQFRQADFADQVEATLAATGARPDLLKLELTERVVMDQIDSVIEQMSAIRALGVSFSVDDFGTGYSSLSYLKRLPLDQLKIDRSFIRDISHDPNDAAIVRAILAMSASLGLQVIAEGVETREQRDFLQRNGCTAYQGYLFGKPMAIEEWHRVFPDIPQP